MGTAVRNIERLIGGLLIVAAVILLIALAQGLGESVGSGLREWIVR